MKLTKKKQVPTQESGSATVRRRSGPNVVLLNKGAKFEFITTTSSKRQFWGVSLVLADIRSGLKAIEAR